MRYAVFWDLHLLEYVQFQKEIERYSIDSLICTGDFDKPEIILWFKQWQEQIISKRGKVYRRVLNNTTK